MGQPNANRLLGMIHVCNRDCITDTNPLGLAWSEDPDKNAQRVKELVIEAHDAGMGGVVFHSTTGYSLTPRPVVDGAPDVTYMHPIKPDNGTGRDDILAHTLGLFGGIEGSSVYEWLPPPATYDHRSLGMYLNNIPTDPRYCPIFDGGAHPIASTKDGIKWIDNARQVIGRIGLEVPNKRGDDGCASWWMRDTQNWVSAAECGVWLRRLREPEWDTSYRPTLLLMTAGHLDEYKALVGYRAQAAEGDSHSFFMAIATACVLRGGIARQAAYPVARFLELTPVQKRTLIEIGADA